MEKHTLTKLQADLLGTPALAGVEVDVVVLEGSENCFPYFPDVPVARDVYYQGVRLGGGYLRLQDVSWDDLVEKEKCSYV